MPSLSNILSGNAFRVISAEGDGLWISERMKGDEVQELLLEDGGLVYVSLPIGKRRLRTNLDEPGNTIIVLGEILDLPAPIIEVNF